MMARQLRKLARDRTGATAVEFSLVAIPLALVLFGTVEYGRLEWTRSALVSVANASARCMGIPQTECSTGGSYDADRARTFAVDRGAGLSLVINPDSIDLDRTATCNGVSGFSQVTIGYTFRTAFPFLFGRLKGGVPMSAEVCFPNQPSA